MLATLSIRDGLGKRPQSLKDKTCENINLCERKEHEMKLHCKGLLVL